MTVTTKLDYRLNVGQELSATDEYALIVNGSSWRQVLIEGRVTASATAPPHNIGAIGVGVDDTLGMPRTLTIAETASVIVNSSAPQTYVFAISANGRGIKVINHGVIDVRSGGEARGISVSGGGLENRGTISVSAPGSAVAVTLAGDLPRIGECKCRRS